MEKKGRLCVGCETSTSECIFTRTFFKTKSKKDYKWEELIGEDTIQNSSWNVSQQDSNQITNVTTQVPITQYAYSDSESLFIPYGDLCRQNEPSVINHSNTSRMPENVIFPPEDIQGNPDNTTPYNDTVKRNQ